MTKNLVWRLSKLPTPDELVQLVKDKIITQEEAREILFKSETQEDRDADSLKAEIKFLRELVEKLAQKPAQIVEMIKYVEKPYYKWNWYEPYRVYCNNETLYLSGTTTQGTSFNSIQTF